MLLLFFYCCYIRLRRTSVIIINTIHFLLMLHPLHGLFVHQLNCVSIIVSPAPRASVIIIITIYLLLLFHPLRGFLIIDADGCSAPQERHIVSKHRCITQTVSSVGAAHRYLFCYHHPIAFLFLFHPPQADLCSIREIVLFSIVDTSNPRPQKNSVKKMTIFIARNKKRKLSDEQGAKAKSIYSI